MMREKLLIVDDQEDLRKMLRLALGYGKYLLFEAADGAAALEIARAERPDVMLLDVMMPKKTGYEVCQQIRANPSLSGVKIVMLTAKGRDTEVAKGLDLGADAYMTKPFSTKDLVAQVRALLGIS